MKIRLAYIVFCIMIMFYTLYLVYAMEKPFFNKSQKIEGFEDSHIELVISRYNENLEWLKDEPFSKYTQIIYNKGSNEDFFKSSRLKQNIPLENVGVCVHTYLYHIINNYDNLADVTVFLPGSCMDSHKKEKTLKTIEYVDKTKNSVFIVDHLENNINDKNNSIYNFTLENYELANSKNKELNTDQKLNKCSIRPFGKWYDHLFPDININSINYNGIFAVSREHIQNRTKESYQELITYVNKDKNEECAHYFERAFLAVFHPIPNNCLI